MKRTVAPARCPNCRKHLQVKDLDAADGYCTSCDHEAPAA